MQIWFYMRECQLGDYVFADGSFSNILRADKTVVGVCFYIDANDKSRRLCVSTQAPQNLNCWGLYDDQNVSVGFDSIALADNPSLSVFDIPTLQNKESGFSALDLNESTYRDFSGGDELGFRIFPQSTAAAELGWTALDINIGGFERGTSLPWGQTNTLKILAHRNTILGDSNINLQIPAKTNNQSEMENLLELLSKVVEDNANEKKYRQFYYPAASYCHAFTPSVKTTETLSEKLREGQWWLPSYGEALRLGWYFLLGNQQGNNEAVFSNAIANGLLKIPEGYLWSSSEVTLRTCYRVNVITQRIDSGTKYSDCIILPIAAF